MIVLYHLNNKIQEVVTAQNRPIELNKSLCIAKGLQVLATQFPDKKIVWCHLHFKQNLNLKFIETKYHHNLLMMSFQPEDHHFLDKKIGYVETSVFIKVNKKVSYPTWQMSSVVGVIHASVLLTLKEQIKCDTDFDYYLNSLAKLVMPLGLFCYSEPRLLIGNIPLMASKPEIITLFKFVKQHYKTRWLFLLVLNMMIYEKKFKFFSFIYALCFFKKRYVSVNFEIITLQSDKLEEKVSIDVIIPTIGRKAYLYDVLCDLKNQTHLPKQVIIVEQNPLKASISELDYVISESWPFKIKHHFIHQTGACNARNIALSLVESDWVFFNDDDNRFGKNLISDVLAEAIQFRANAVTTAYPQKNETVTVDHVCQSGVFGAGNSFLKTASLKGVCFNMAFEFGYGEDSDFGMQLRNKGIDIVYLPEPSILHLKAPIGGFRVKPSFAWDTDEVKPKPSPTVMLFQLLHQTKHQRLGYKTMLFLKFYNKQKTKNPLAYYTQFKKQWDRSQFWANQLKQEV